MSSEGRAARLSQGTGSLHLPNTAGEASCPPRRMLLIVSFSQCFVYSPGMA